jgi:hypothetical protein
MLVRRLHWYMIEYCFSTTLWPFASLASLFFSLVFSALAYRLKTFGYSYLSLKTEPLKGAYSLVISGLVLGH